MDLSVGEVDNSAGITFTRTQRSIGANAVGLFWGFIGWFDTHDSTTTTTASVDRRFEADWSQGQVRVDALLGPREVDGFTPPAQVDIGPRLYFSQGTVTDSTTAGVHTRATTLRITLLKADGSANPSKNLVVDAGGLIPSFTTGGGFTGSTTNTDGQVELRISRQAPAGVTLTPRQFAIRVELGQISSTATVTL
jgi:hypothetical protein